MISENDDLKKRTLDAMDRLTSRPYPINLEANSDDEFCYMLFHEIFGGVPNVMYFFDEITHLYPDQTL